VHFEISKIKSFVEEVTAGAFDDQFAVFDAEGIGIFAGSPGFQVFAVEQVGPLSVGGEAGEE
jgi:hypothetical protein